MAEATYDVVLLAEQVLSGVDAREVVALHEELEIDQEVRYHLLIPVEDAAARVEAMLSTLGTSEAIALPAMAPDVDITRIHEECVERSREALATSLAELRSLGVVADGTTIEDSPIDALIRSVNEHDGREAIILTRPHLVAEFFHVDWTSRARRKLEVPVLHLLEHEAVTESAT